MLSRAGRHRLLVRGFAACHCVAQLSRAGPAPAPVSKLADGDAKLNFVVTATISGGSAKYDAVYFYFRDRVDAGDDGQPRAQFEVVSIRPYVSQGNPANERSALDFPPGGRFSATNVSVRKLIRVAFGVENERILGIPGWADTLTYNIEAKTVDGVESRAQHF